MIGGTTDIVYEFLAASAWTVSGASYTGATPLVSAMAITPSGSTGRETAPTGLFLAPSTKNWYFTGTATDRIIQMQSYTSDRIDTSTSVYHTLASTFVSEANPGAIHFSPNGRKLYYSRSDLGMREVNCPTPFSLVGASAGRTFKAITGVGLVQPQLSYFQKFSNDGRYLYVFESTSDYVAQYRCEEAWNPDTASYITTMSFATTSMYDIAFSQDGQNMFYTNETNVLQKRTLSTPWMISTRSASATAVTFSTISTGTDYRGLHFTRDGKVLYLAEVVTGGVIRLQFEQPYFASGAILKTEYVSTAAQGTDPSSIEVSPDGTTFFVSDNTNDRIYQYTLRTDTL
jgi:sugar lactone lactonase YvrE